MKQRMGIVQKQVAVGREFKVRRKKGIKSRSLFNVTGARVSEDGPWCSHSGVVASNVRGIS